MHILVTRIIEVEVEKMVGHWPLFFEPTECIFVEALTKLYADFKKARAVRSELLELKGVKGAGRSPGAIFRRDPEAKKRKLRNTL